VGAEPDHADGRQRREQRRLAGTSPTSADQCRTAANAKLANTRRTTMTHVRPDVPQPDPIVHDKPGDVPQVPCAEELDEHKPGAPYGNQTVADTDDPQTT